MYDIRALNLDEEELNKTQTLLTEVFPKSSHFSTQYLKWQYLENPDGNAIGYNAYDGDKLIAHYACQPMRSQLHQKEAKGLLSINTAVHSDYRGKNLFKDLANKTFYSAKEKGYAFIIGVANANSTTLFRKWFKFNLICPLDVKIGFGCISYQPRI